MPDGLALSATALLAAGLIALAMVWPQGQGARSPAPFGHPVGALPAPVIEALKSRGAAALKHPLAALRGPEPPAPTLPPHPARNSPF